MTFPEFIQYMMTAEGIGAALGVVLYFIGRYWPKFQDLTSQDKRLVMFLAAMVIPLPFSFLAIPFGLTNAPTSYVELVNRFIWPSLQAGFVAFTASQLAHARELRNRK